MTAVPRLLPVVAPRHRLRRLPASAALVVGFAVFAAAAWPGGLTRAQEGGVVTTAPATQPAEAGRYRVVVPAAPAAAGVDPLAAREGLLSGLVGSKHDFTEGGKSGRDLCMPCHTPHLPGASPALLDRRTETVRPLRPYRGLDLQLSGASLMCLGCHDGVAAPDVYSSAHAVTSALLGNARLGTRGLRSHPVGIAYPTAAEGYEPRVAVEAAGLPLPEGRIQCTTCHDPHNTYRYSGMLQISNERSRLCLSCHRL